jgi:hypothetical protein
MLKEELEYKILESSENLPHSRGTDLPEIDGYSREDVLEHIKYWRNSTWLLICKGSATYCYTIFNSILALRVLICPNEVSFAPLEGILAGRRRASARRACVTGARRV